MITKTYIDKSVELSFATIVGGRTESTKCAYILFTHGEDGNPLIGEETMVSSAYLESLDKPDNIGSGKRLMHAVIFYLRIMSEERTRHGMRPIEYIQLKDHSFTIINKVRIELPDYYTLTRGTTYYSQFGFLPFDEDKLIEDADGVLDLQMNENTMKAMRVSTAAGTESWFIELFPKYEKYVGQRVGHVIRHLFRHHPNEITPHIRYLYHKLKLVSLSKTSQLRYQNSR